MTASVSAQSAVQEVLAEQDLGPSPRQCWSWSGRPAPGRPPSASWWPTGWALVFGTPTVTSRPPLVCRSRTSSSPPARRSFASWSGRRSPPRWPSTRECWLWAAARCWRPRPAPRGLPVVWLRTGLADAAKRVGLARDRPVLALNPRGELARLLEQRTPHYAAVALAAVDTDGRTPAEVADAVLAELGALTTELGALTTETGRRP